jgi:ubiquinone/menaquinone biosynthesis C-methylase UbiE
MRSPDDAGNCGDPGERDGIAQAVSGCLSGEIPPNVALMQIIMGARAADEVERAVRTAHRRARRGGNSRAADRAGRLLALWQRMPDAWRVVNGILAQVQHEPAGAPDQAIATVAAMFDRAARISPEASVALYSLGDSDLLSQATAEIVDRMQEWHLLGPDRDLLEIGCGIGRLLSLLASHARSVAGIDVSRAMIEAASRRCAAQANVFVSLTSGRDLAAFGDHSFDLVYAVDTFPYLLQAGRDVAARHVHEAARVLRPDGALLIMNFSYRDDVNTACADVARLADETGFEVLRNGSRDCSVWDGLTFHLRRKAAPSHSRTRTRAPEPIG